jgi:DNA-binding NarL/FixJ family response regulator
LERIVLDVALLLIGYVIIYLVLKKKIGRLLDPTSVLRQIRDEVDRIIAELNQTTDRNVTLIEDRIRAVSELLGSTDKKIGLLRRETQKHDSAGRLYAELGSKSKILEQQQPEGQAQRAPEKQDIHEQVLRLYQQGVSPAGIARQLGITLAEIELIVSLAGRKR